MNFFNSKLLALYLVLIHLVLIQMTGCSTLFGDNSYFRDRKNDYMRAQVTKTVTVPEVLDDTSIDELYVIPLVASRAGATKSFEVPRPAPLSTSNEKEVVVIQRLGQDQWVLVNISPSQLWPQLKHFLANNKISIDEEDGSQGTIDTAWLISSRDEAMREKYRFFVEQGLQRNMSEVHIRQIERSATQSSSLDWDSYKSQVKREGWMTEELANFLASKQDTTSVSLLAQGISTESRMTIESDEAGVAYILLQLPYDRSWASIGRALKKSQFSVKDMDRSEGIYYVRYEPRAKEDEKPGFWGRLFSDGDELIDTDYAGESYRLQMQELANGIKITIQASNAVQEAEVEVNADMHRNKIAKAEAEELLSLLKSNML